MKLKEVWTFFSIFVLKHTFEKEFDGIPQIHPSPSPWILYCYTVFAKVITNLQWYKKIYREQHNVSYL